jgi:hypothetical protein
LATTCHGGCGLEEGSLQSTAQARALSQANLYQLSGGGRHVMVALNGIDGKPHFSYQDAHHTLAFEGDEIRQLDGDLGLVASVSIRRTVDQGSTSFSVLLPHVNVPGEQTVPITTEGITTVHRFSLVPALDHGQLDTYTVTRLHGTATHVFF